MTRSLKSQGLALIAALALGAMLASSASATEREFHSDGPWTVSTGENTEAHVFKVGSAGSVTCTKAEFENRSWGSEVSASTYKADQLTVIGRWSGCTFGGMAAVVKTNHCAFVVDSDTTKTENPEGGEDSNVEIECAEGNKIEVHTSICTVTVGPQVVIHALRASNDTPTSMKGGITGGLSGGGIVLGKVRTTASQPLNGCLTFPTGALGTFTGEATSKCFEDEGSELSSTNKTTPQGLLKEGKATECSIE